MDFLGVLYSWRTWFRKFQFRCRTWHQDNAAKVNFKCRQTEWAAYSCKLSVFIFAIFILRRVIIRRHVRGSSSESDGKHRATIDEVNRSTNHLNVIKVDYNDNSHGSPASAHSQKGHFSRLESRLHFIFCTFELGFIVGFFYRTLSFLPHIFLLWLLLLLFFVDFSSRDLLISKRLLVHYCYPSALLLLCSEIIKNGENWNDYVLVGCLRCEFATQLFYRKTDASTQ